VSLAILEMTEIRAVKRLVLALTIISVPALAFAAGTKSENAKTDRARTRAEKFERMLMEIDPAERFIQVCSLAAAERISKDKTPYKADRAVMDASGPAKVDGDKMTGDGAAFRSKGDWYQFSFSCEASPDHLKVLSFNYQVGTKIPEEKWETFGLWR
jgi:replicative DNA helicase